MEPADDALEPHPDSYCAIIEENRSETGAGVQYYVRRKGQLVGEPIPRCRLRHRDWYSIL